MKSKKFFKSLMEQLFDGDRRSGKEEAAAAAEEEEELEAAAVAEQRVFRYEALAAATRRFSARQKLGEGGFGPVYKGRLEDGREVAVKRLGMASRQGAKEFMNEAMMLSKVQHKNLVNLYGYCAHGHEKLLVYEFVPNQSLDKILFSREKENSKRAELDWRRRLQVITGVARGLLYLHEDAPTTVVHRDIKASNILLDDDWSPKIADFGMARLFPAAEHADAVKTCVVGTNGYMAPEYVLHGSLSTKVDVFSFGVVVLELVSGRRNAPYSPLPDPEARSLLDWAWRLHKKGQAMVLLDPALESAADAEQVATCVHVGLLCVQPDPKLRPNMERVMLILSKRPRTLEEPTRPGVPVARHPKNPRQAANEHGASSRSSVESSSSTVYSATAATTWTTMAAHQSPLHQEPHSEPL